MSVQLPQIRTGQAPAETAGAFLRGVEARGADPVPSLYIHVPFCFHKCHYCDFYSLVDTRDRQDAFVHRLEEELRALAPLARGSPIATIFVGGGTPTLLRPDLWRRVLAALDAVLDFSGLAAGRGEFTVECNPETASPELFDVLRAGGVSRLSMGAQSFDPRHLKTLERWHDPASVERAVSLARAAGIERLSVDLIFAIPGQTLDEWKQDLDRAIDLGVSHLSCYALTYEPNTAMTARLGRGEFERCDEDLEADMYEATLARCRAAGLERYEVSNFARPGEESRHNLAYWRQESWLAAGPSASGHLLDPAGGSWRWKNAPRLDDYLRKSDRGLAPVVDLELPDARRLAAERIMSGLRLAEGIDLLDAVRPVEESDPDRAGSRSVMDVAAAQVRLGRGVLRDGRITLTDSGFLFADAVARDFLAALR